MTSRSSPRTSGRASTQRSMSCSSNAPSALKFPALTGTGVPAIDAPRLNRRKLSSTRLTVAPHGSVRRLPLQIRPAANPRPRAVALDSRGRHEDRRRAARGCGSPVGGPSRAPRGRGARRNTLADVAARQRQSRAPPWSPGIDQHRVAKRDTPSGTRQGRNPPACLVGTRPVTQAGRRSGVGTHRPR